MRSLVLALLLAAGSAALAEPRHVDLVPLGEALPADDVAAVRDALVAMYGAVVRVRSAVPLPRAAYYARRHRYRADDILDWLAKQPEDGADQLLALTGVDISTTKGSVEDWGVLGLGAIDGKAGVLSRFRCDMGGGHPVRARERLAKVAVHELGHTLGLQHCSTPHCLMGDAEGKVATADGEYDLCPRCRALLAERGIALPASPKPPWHRP